MSFNLNLLYIATDNLIDQQFYLNGQDTIIGRTYDISLHIKHSGIIIRKFKDLINQNIYQFLEDDYYSFLLNLTKIKGITIEDIYTVHEKLIKKLEILKENVDNLDDITTYSIVLGYIISKIRDFHFQHTIDAIFAKIKLKPHGLSNLKIKENLEKLFMLNDKNISILYNIGYLEALADSFNFKKVARVCRMLKGKYINRVIEIILNPNN